MIFSYKNTPCVILECFKEIYKKNRFYHEIYFFIFKNEYRFIIIDSKNLSVTGDIVRYIKKRIKCNPDIFKVDNKYKLLKKLNFKISNDQI